MKTCSYSMSVWSEAVGDVTDITKVVGNTVFVKI